MRRRGLQRRRGKYAAMKRSRSDQPERFVAEIQYAQTKDYVKSNVRHRVYTTFYNEQLILRPELIGENEDVAK